MIKIDWKSLWSLFATFSDTHPALCLTAVPITPLYLNAWGVRVPGSHQHQTSRLETKIEQLEICRSVCIHKLIWMSKSVSSLFRPAWLCFVEIKLQLIFLPVNLLSWKWEVKLLLYFRFCKMCNMCTLYFFFFIIDL